MRSVRLRRAAQRDLIEITRYIARQAGAREPALKFRDTLLRECARIAKVTALLGRSRADLRSGLRSVPYRSYIIFFTYPDEHTVEIVRFLHAARDIPAIFESESD